MSGPQACQALWCRSSLSAYNKRRENPKGRRYQARRLLHEAYTPTGSRANNREERTRTTKTRIGNHRALAQAVPVGVPHSLNCSHSPTHPSSPCWPCRATEAPAWGPLRCRLILPRGRPPIRGPRGAPHGRCQPARGAGSGRVLGRAWQQGVRRGGNAGGRGHQGVRGGGCGGGGLGQEREGRRMFGLQCGPGAWAGA